MDRIWSLAAFGLIVLPQAGAAETAAPVDEIVVTATRLPERGTRAPVAVSVVDSDALSAGYQQVGLDEALTGVPGLFIQDRYNFAQDLRIAIRGFGARSSFGIRGIRLTVDDIPLTLPDGQGQFDSLDLASASRVEIVRGPAAALYGNAGGGLIRVTSEDPGRTPFARVGLATGGDGFGRARAKFGGATPLGAVLVSASTLDFDGYREHSRTRQHLLNAVLKSAPRGDDELVLTLNVADQPLAEDPGGVNAPFAAATPTAARPQNVSFDAGESLRQVRLGATYRHSVGDGLALRWRAYGVDRDFDNRLPFTGGGQVELARRFVGGGVAISAERSSTITWLAGIDVDDQRDDRQRFDNELGARGARTLAQDEDVRAIGAYASVQLALGPRWQLTAGGRYDWVRFRVDDAFLADGDDSGLRRYRTFNPVLGATYAMGAGHSFYANVARSFETPTTTEFANPAGGGFNPQLEPAFARSYELGWRWQPDRSLDVAVAAFRIDLTDELVPFELPAQPDRDFFDNAGKSRRDGLEAEFGWQLSEVWRLSAAAAVNDFRFREFADVDGERTPGIPRHTAQLAASARWASGVYGALDVQRIGRIALNNAGTEVQSAYTLVNVRAGVDVARGGSIIALFAGINNALDETYPANVRINAFGGRFFEPAPERYAYAGFDWRFAL